MNKKYECKLCNYSSDRLLNFNRHLKSKKHLKNFANNTETLHRPP